MAAAPRTANPVVVVTGGSSGLGLAIAQRFAQQPMARVVLVARGEETLADAAGRCRALGAEVLTHAADVADADALTALVRRVEENFGRIDVWVNAAGTSLWGWFDTTPAEAHERLLRTNLLGVIHGSHAALQHMRGRAGGGVIVNIGSVAGALPMPLAASYTASKYGVAGFTEALRDELCDTAIAVCGVYPGFVDTPAPQRAANYTGRELRPIPPLLDPDEVAEAVEALVRHPRRAIRPGLQHLAALPHALAPDATGRAVSRAARRFFLDSGDKAPDSDGALFAPRPLRAAVHGHWGRQTRPEAGGWAWGLLGTAAAVAGVLGGLAWSARRRRG